MRNLKFLLCVLICCVFVFTSVSCKENNGDSQSGSGSSSDISGEENLPDGNDDAYTDRNGNKGLKTNKFRIDFVRKTSGYEVQICNASSDTVLWSGTPANLLIKGKAKSLLGGFDEGKYSSAYESVTRTDYGYRASANVKTKAGSEIEVRDCYWINSDEFVVTRYVIPKKVANDDKGVSSAFKLTSEKEGKYSYFIPSIVYNDGSDMPDTAIMSNFSLTSSYVMETRTGLPMAMIYSEQTGSALSLVHYNPSVSSSNQGGGSDGDVNDGLKYASVGFEKSIKATVGLRYPCAEGPSTYEGAVQGWTRLYHTLKEGVADSYEVAIIPSEKDNYADSMTDSYMRAYALNSPKKADGVNIDDIWNYNMEMFSDTYKEWGTDGNKTAGVPWSMDLVSKTKNTPYSFQMGFVGQQTSVGAQMLREGITSNNAEMRRKGETILDFWTSNRVFISRNALPVVWYDPSNSGGSPRNYPCFLRAFVDGAEGILDGYIIAKRAGGERTEWKNAVLKVADFLVNNQNEDGSYYRAYNVDGSVNIDKSDRAIQGDSKYNTPEAVRFLLRVYELTGKNEYKTAALKAADYSYENFYKGKMKYVGGTIDQYNVVDREAAIFALYCFESAYSVTGEEKYLAAAKHAAASAMSWVYTYDFKVYNSASDENYNPFRNGGVSGFSIIATGHSGADNFAAYLYYSYFRMYIHTGESIYLDMAEFLQKNTKTSSDYTGKLGYAYRAIATEATRVANFSYSSVNAWLPWSSIANIDPIAKMRDTFGTADVTAVQGTREQLKTILDAYGVGGKLN